MCLATPDACTTGAAMRRANPAPINATAIAVTQVIASMNQPSRVTSANASASSISARIAHDTPSIATGANADSTATPR